MNRYTVFIILNFLAFFSFAQHPVSPGWKLNIKNSLNSINKSHSVLIDREQNCYILGTTWIADTTKNIILIKLDTSGEELWQRVYDNPKNGDDIPMDMSIDKLDNVWICGLSRLGPGKADFLILKFNPDGILLADKLYDGKENKFDSGNSIISDNQGNIFAAGYETTSDSGINMVLFKYTNDAELLWKRGYATRQMDIANQLMVDDSNNVYVCGISNNGPHSADILVQKYDPLGKLKWQLVKDGPMGQSDIGQFISADDSMNIYISGFTNHANSRADIPLIKLNRNGKVLQENYHFGRIADCGAKHLVAYKNSVLLVGGCEDYTVSASSSFLLEFNKAGKELKKITAPEDVVISVGRLTNNHQLLFGTKLTHPESTLIPFISEIDSSEFTWTFSDSTISGIANITSIETSGNDVYFLGDDTGDATGTISIMKYSLILPEKGNNKKNPPLKKKK